MEITSTPQDTTSHQLERTFPKGKENLGIAHHASVQTFQRSVARSFLTALHESGHAIIGWLLGYEIKYVTIIPTKSWGGHCQLANSNSYFNYFMVLRAGKLAERIADASRDVCYGPGEWDEGSDAQKLYEVGEVLIEDKTDLINNMDPFDALYLEVDELLTDMIDCESIRNAIISLAQELLLRQKLSGQEVEAIIEPILGSAPWYLHDESLLSFSDPSLP